MPTLGGSARTTLHKNATMSLRVLVVLCLVCLVVWYLYAEAPVYHYAEAHLYTAERVASKCADAEMRRVAYGSSKELHIGPRCGLYYFTASGNKKYV